MGFLNSTLLRGGMGCKKAGAYDNLGYFFETIKGEIFMYLKL